MCWSPQTAARAVHRQVMGVSAHTIYTLIGGILYGFLANLISKPAQSSMEVWRTFGNLREIRVPWLKNSFLACETSGRENRGQFDPCPWGAHPVSFSWATGGTGSFSRLAKQAKTQKDGSRTHVPGFMSFCRPMHRSLSRGNLSQRSISGHE